MSDADTFALLALCGILMLIALVWQVSRIADQLEQRNAIAQRRAARERRRAS